VAGIAVLFRWRRGTLLATCRLSGTRTRVISAMTLMGGRSKSEVGRTPSISTSITLMMPRIGKVQALTVMLFLVLPLRRCVVSS
jgi:hypothetical protein